MIKGFSWASKDLLTAEMISRAAHERLTPGRNRSAVTDGIKMFASLRPICPLTS